MDQPQRFCVVVDAVSYRVEAYPDPAAGVARVVVDGLEYNVVLGPDNCARVEGNGRSDLVWLEAGGSANWASIDGVAVPTQVRSWAAAERSAALGQVTAGPQGGESVFAPMPGRVVKVLVAPGDTVSRGQPLAIVEAMKMENEIMAPRDGQIARVDAVLGKAVEAGALLVQFEHQSASV